MDRCEQYRRGRVRYWAAAPRRYGRGLRHAQMKVGRRLAVKILNARKFVLAVLDPHGAAAAGSTP